MIQRRVSRAKYNQALSETMRERRLRLAAEEKLAATADSESTSQRQAADTITRLSSDNQALRGILAGLLVAMEADGRVQDAYSLRRQVHAADLDLTVEVAERRPDPKARPAKRVYTVGEAALLAELHRTRKALAAFESQCLDLQHVNTQQARQLREHAERANEVTS